MEDEDEESKTEEPSQRRLEKAREEGDVPKSQEVPVLFTLASIALVISMALGPTMKGLVAPLGNLIDHADTLRVDSGFGNTMTEFLFLVGPLVALPLGLMLVAGVASHLVQTPFNLTPNKLMPDFSKVNPLEGFKRQFSMEAIMNLVKGLIKLVVVASVMFSVLWPRRDQLDMVLSSEPVAQLEIMRDLASRVMIAVVSAYVAIAVLDYLWVRQRWMRRHRMSLHEIKQEHKESEGDPHIKGRLRQIRQQRARKRMTSAIPKATVVITNPTHYAVALRYERGMAAPVCVAKGADEIARVIRELATAHNVPIVENPPLARALYASVDVDRPIREDHFRAVAEVIGYVMGMKSRRRWQAG